MCHVNSDEAGVAQFAELSTLSGDISQALDQSIRKRQELEAQPLSDVTVKEFHESLKISVDVAFHKVDKLYLDKARKTKLHDGATGLAVMVQGTLTFISLSAYTNII